MLFLANLIIFSLSLLFIVVLLLKKLPQISALPTEGLKDRGLRPTVAFVKSKTQTILANAVKPKQLKQQKVKKQKLNNEEFAETSTPTTNNDDYWQNVKEV